MKKYETKRYIVLAILGVLLFIMGLILLLLFPEGNGILKTAPFILVGIGSGIFGGNIGTLLKNKAMIKNSHLAKMADIEEKDERNIFIINKAKAKAYDFMIYAFGALLLAFSLMNIDIYVILSLVAVYLIFVFINIYYINKFNKEM